MLWGSGVGLLSKENKLEKDLEILIIKEVKKMIDIEQFRIEMSYCLNNNEVEEIKEYFNKKNDEDIKNHAINEYFKRLIQIISHLAHRFLSNYHGLWILEARIKK